jgi:hypothetical protein
MSKRLKIIRKNDGRKERNSKEGQNGRNGEVDKERPVATGINDDGFL